MHHVRFRDPAGAVRTGEWHDDAITFGGEHYAHEDVEILPPSEPSKIVCIGRNYADHAAEHGADVPDRPMLFLKGPNTLAGHGDTVTLPSGKDRLDWEAEIGVVISEQCRNVAAEDAMDVVAGFTCFNDISNRDDQREEQNWVRGKAFDGSAPMGPVLADPEHVPEDARVTLRVNGETKQDGSRDQMVFNVPTLIEEITTYLTLEPGDVIATGTPEGVGPLSDGDHVEVEVEGVGTLEHSVRIP
ncbi:2-hydroxyhepta-2,4-diene-1,7-dioate isomerase [Haloprofundus marisrubri]|uniref:2-hydroxyhepta-2,4-diene-1,7-dioate isomerase n=1 Tax=Haloprofundus marisrubri TaxID=1514971 RepID=A0A0W1R9E2_9EURY|nr:fumarylacetoacetate hydrolase family protein [Haloprofundus marisrubri]KTG10153.1 2-hydroxyhepta-2,4-diene-1,7-dioate isomerase [Haloprofundus marisrubri]